jgi:hypothetical protein
MLGYCCSKNFRMALDHLRSQTVCSLLELIIVTPSRKKLDLAPSDLAGLSNYKILELGVFKSEGAAKAAGVMAANTPLVAFLEDHSYPEPFWAEALIDAHSKGNFAVVGPIMLNANPYCGASWGAFLVFYGQWMRARPQKEVKHLPGNHSCYNRELLLRYGPRVPEMLETESVLQWDLLDKGHRLYQEPRARVYHLNSSRLGQPLSEYYVSSRIFATSRARHWNRIRRVLYALGSPLLPLIRLRRVLNDAGRAQLRIGVTLRALMTIFLTLCAGAAGEISGYAFGEGKARNDLLRILDKRHLFYTPHDLEAASKVSRTPQLGD